jgi:hypothetical protein
MTSLRLRMLEDMQIRNLAVNTQESYVQQVSVFARYFNRVAADAALRFSTSLPTALFFLWRPSAGDGSQSSKARITGERKFFSETQGPRGFAEPESTKRKAWHRDRPDHRTPAGGTPDYARASRTVCTAEKATEESEVLPQPRRRPRRTPIQSGCSSCACLQRRPWPMIESRSQVRASPPGWPHCSLWPNPFRTLRQMHVRRSSCYLLV